MGRKKRIGGNVPASRASGEGSSTLRSATAKTSITNVGITSTSESMMNAAARSQKPA